VVAFGGEQRAQNEYSYRLMAGYKLNIRKTIFSALGIATLMLILYLTYSLAFYVGSILVANNEMRGGQVVNVFFAVVIGAFCKYKAFLPNILQP
jgi:ABC-type multidrug transport system fused ATPase/permease subunit